MNEEEKDKYIIDDAERKQSQDFKLGNRRTPLSNNILMLLGDLLQPQTLGFEWVNMDMSFSFQDKFDVQLVKNSTLIITYCAMYGLKKPLLLERSNLATHLNINKSLNGKSMELFTHTVTTQKQEFMDKTDKKTGFSRLFAGKKVEGDSK